MIHIEFGPSTIVGMGLTIIGILLYALRTKKPNVSRDYDLFFSSVGLLCGGILIFQGWRLDPILLLCQILLSGTAIFFIGESLYRRNNKLENKNFFTQSVKKIDNFKQEKNQLVVNIYNARSDSKYNRIIPSSKNPWKGIYYTNPIDFQKKLEKNL